MQADSVLTEGVEQTLPDAPKWYLDKLLAHIAGEEARLGIE